jgi:hypothetical protein
MNNKLSHILRHKLDGLEWVDKISGLVQTVSIREKVGENIVLKSYPISCDLAYEEAIKGRYQDLTPNSKKKSILYFEDKGCSMIERKGNTIKYQSSLRLVCWLNLKAIHGATCNEELEHCQVSGHYVIEVIKTLPSIPFTQDHFVGIYIEDISQAVRSVDIFSKYSYNEQSTQYLLFPFDFFALDLKINFTIPCISTL